MQVSTISSESGMLFQENLAQRYQSIFETSREDKIIYYRHTNQMWFYGSLTDDTLFWKYRDLINPILTYPEKFICLELNLYNIQLNASSSKRLIQFFRKVKSIPKLKMIWHYDLSDEDQHRIVYEFSRLIDHQLHLRHIMNESQLQDVNFL